MKTKKTTRLVLLIVMSALAGCVSVDKGKDRAPAAGRGVLDSLQEGMKMEEVIRKLGRPTSLATLESHGTGESWHELTYSNTVIDPGVVELYFQPGLSLIRIDTRIYKDFTHERSD